MHLGAQIVAPRGCGNMVAGVTYYFTARTGHNILLSWFCKTSNGWRVYCLVFLSLEFEAALTADPPLIEICAVQFALPPWLHNGDELNYDDKEDDRYAEKTRSYRDQVNSRLTQIICLLDREEEILRATKPLKAISKIARENEIYAHPHRLQLWFFAYVLHGHEFWALKQPTQDVGKWDRESEKHKGRRFGLPHPNGRGFGWAAWKMREQIIKSYEKRRALGITMAAIHREALRKDFGCLFIETADGVYECYHPKNESFPSYGQFRAEVLKKYTLEEVHMARFGAATLRQRATVEIGNFTEKFADLLESVEVDAYFLPERPRSIFSDDPMPPLVVARGVCVTSGVIVGVGFSLGGENADAYRSMLFCMAVPKSLIAKIYGIPLKALNWIAQGVPASITSDRGPGGGRKLVADDLNAKFPIKTITVSYAGQGKAVGESSHPASDNLDGPPSYIVSELNVVQMMKREIIRGASDNHTSDISHRLNDEAVREFHKQKWPATPHNFWKYLAARMRTAARRMTVDQAVRAFLPQIELRVDNHGIRYRTHYYSSDEFKESGTHKRIAPQRDISITGYGVPLTMLYIWAEIGGRLYELKAFRRMATDADDSLLSLEDVNQSEAALKAVKAQTRLSTQAASAAAAANFEEITGKSWSDGKRQRGSPTRKNAKTDREARTIAGKIDSRKVA